MMILMQLETPFFLKRKKWVSFCSEGHKEFWIVFDRISKEAYDDVLNVFSCTSHSLHVFNAKNLLWSIYSSVVKDTDILFDMIINPQPVKHG